MTNLARRSFLHALTSVAIAWGVWPVEILATPPIPPAEPATVQTLLRLITCEVAQQLHDRCPNTMTVPLRDQQLGNDIPHLRRRTCWQFGVDMSSAVDGNHMPVVTTAACIAHALAQRCHDAGVTQFGIFPIPASVEEGTIVTTSRVSVRGLASYNICLDRFLLRFDVLGT